MVKSVLLRSGSASLAAWMQGLLMRAELRRQLNLPGDKRKDLNCRSCSEPGQEGWMKGTRIITW
jgi:hypothetical protein